MKYEIQEAFSSLKPMIENLPEYFLQADSILHKERNEIRVVSYAGSQYVVKAFKVPNLLNRFVYRYVRASKARRSYEHSIRVGAEVCPEAVAYVEYTKNGLLDVSYFVSRYFEADYTIRTALRDKDLKDRDSVLQQFADFTFALHERHVLHKDYSPGNILVKEEGGTYRFQIVDVNRMVFRPLSLKARAGNFAKLMMDEDTSRKVLLSYAARIGVGAEAFLLNFQRCREALIRRGQLKRKLRGY